MFSCSIKNQVEIKLDKKIVLTGETVTARLYVKHVNSIIPAFYILYGLDTARIPIDENDKQCGVYKAAFRSMGIKKISGFVIFTNDMNKKDTINYKFEFEVEGLPTLPGQ
jgi:hypothetical protein